MKAKITFSYAGNIGGLGQGYITAEAIMAALKMHCLYQLFSCGIQANLKVEAQELVTLRHFNEFTFAWGFLARFLKRAGLTYYISNAFYDREVARQLKACDIFHAFAAQSLKSILKAKSYGAKIVVDNPNTYPLNIKKLLAEEYKIWKVPYAAYNNIALKRRLRALEIADRALVLSQNSYQSFLAHGYAKEKLSIIPYGVDAELFRPRSKKDVIFRVLFVGQLSLRKGFQYLLEAWQLSRLKDAELVLAGPVSADGLYALRKFRGKIDFKILGPLTNMQEIAQVYNQASVCVFPSIEEGFGMVVTEALASGLPVIVSENVGAKDLINNGEEGFIVPIRDAGAIKNVILELYEDEKKRERIGQKARSKVEGQSWGNYQNKLIGVYGELLGENK